MRKKIIILLLIILILLLNYNINTTFTFKTFPNNHTIIIDAGHGGIDGGAIGISGALEKDINLAIAMKLKRQIESSGDNAVLIREVDEGLYSEEGTIRKKKIEDLKRRKDIIKEHEGDVFVSIHLNSFPEGKYYGAQVFYEKGHAESKTLAEAVQKSMRDVLDKNNNRVAKSADTYYILEGCNIPSIIVECGFLSNSREESLLRNDGYQIKIAHSIYVGLLEYLNR